MNNTALQLNTKDYQLLTAPDWDLFEDLFFECRGTCPTIHFCEICNISISRIDKRLHRRGVKPLHIQELQAIVQNACDSSTVTIEQMLASNGYVSAGNMARVLDSFKPHLIDVPDYRFREYREPEDVKIPVLDINSYTTFLNNISILSLFISPEEIQHIKDHMQSLFENKTFVRLIDRFRINMEAEQKQQKNVFYMKEEYISTDKLLSVCILELIRKQYLS